MLDHGIVAWHLRPGCNVHCGHLGWVMCGSLLCVDIGMALSDVLKQFCDGCVGVSHSMANSRTNDLAL